MAEKKRGAGTRQLPDEEIGSTQGRSHDNVLDQTLDPEVARESKRKRDRSDMGQASSHR